MELNLFKASVTIDDYTEEDERIVHFVLLQDHLKFIKNEMKKSGEPLPENMTFTLTTSENVIFPLVAYTKSEDFQINLSWDPVEINQRKVLIFFLLFVMDPQANHYEILIIRL